MNKNQKKIKAMRERKREYSGFSRELEDWLPSESENTATAGANRENKARPRRQKSILHQTKPIYINKAKDRKRELR